MSLVLALAGVSLAVHAENADRNKPMQVESDALRYDDLQQISVFSGNVLLTKGSIVIRGERLEVRQDPEGFQHGIVTGSAQKQAFFRQKREGLEEFIEGEADTIEYDGKADTVRFVRKAEMRRLRGTTLADEVMGETILYENLTDRFTVDGAPKTAAGPGRRVRVMLTPKPEGTSAAKAAGAPAAPIVLKPSTQLDKVAP